MLGRVRVASSNVLGLRCLELLLRAQFVGLVGILVSLERDRCEGHEKPDHHSTFSLLDFQATEFGRALPVAYLSEAQSVRGKKV